MIDGDITKRPRKPRPLPNPEAIGFRVDEVRQVSGPGRTKTYALIKAGRLKSVGIGRSSGDFRR
jgi:hypothetical protein